MDFFAYLDRVRSAWSRVPEQGKRLVVLLVIVIVVFVPVRNRLVPEGFGKYGHYRATGLEEVAALDITYAGHQICNDCHDDIVATKSDGYHLNVACEVCHGAAFAHTEDPEEVTLPAPRERSHCVLCHEYLMSRPTGFPQIVAASHNPLKPCIKCHNPHDPVPSEAPRECEACHAAIARTKAVSHHVYVECTHCHNAPEEHKIRPREYRPSKPTTREFCGGCHDRNADADPDIRRVNMEEHGEGYVCWQCHYPHLPEAQ